jgi:hypothetical protein
MIDLKRIDDSERCRRYLRERIRWGRSLSTALAKSIEDFVSFYTFVEDGGSLLDFETGGKKRPRQRVSIVGGHMEEIDTDHDKLAELLAEIARGGDSLLLWEDILWLRDDPALPRFGGEIRMGKTEVFHVLIGRITTKPEDVMACIDDIKGRPGTIGVLSKPGKLTLDLVEHGATLASDVLTAIAKDAQMIFVEVYDGESYLVGAKEPYVPLLDEKVAARSTGAEAARLPAPGLGDRGR